MVSIEIDCQWEEFVSPEEHMTAKFEMKIFIRRIYHCPTSDLRGNEPVICICRSGNGCRGPRSFWTAKQQSKLFEKKRTNSKPTIFIHSSIEKPSYCIWKSRIKLFKRMNEYTYDNDKLDIDFVGIYPQHIYFDFCNDKFDYVVQIVWKIQHS